MLNAETIAKLAILRRSLKESGNEVMAKAVGELLIEHDSLQMLLEEAARGADVVNKELLSQDSLTLDAYQIVALSTAIYPGSGEFQGLDYTTHGLTGEAGEISNKVKKIIRDHHSQVDDLTALDLAKEAGDVLWYVACFAHELGMSLGQIAALNVEKLKSRQARGKLGGSGDER